MKRGAKQAGVWRNRLDLPIDGDRIRQRRKQLGLSQSELGRHLGVQLNTVARWERGEIGIDHPDWVEHQISGLERKKVKPSAPPIDARRLRARRAALGLTVHELAERLGVPAVTVKRWESRRIEMGHAGWLDWRLSEFEAQAAARARGISIHEIVPSDGASMLEHEFRLRPELTVRFALPVNMTAAEAGRLSEFLRTLPFA
jgi:transcriptional regulator with XRE-family HTH domain